MPRGRLRTFQGILGHRLGVRLGRMDDKRPSWDETEEERPGGSASESTDPAFDLPLRLEREPELPLEEAPPDRSGTLAVLAIAGFILIGSAIVTWWWFRGRAAQPVDQTSAGAASAAVATAAAEVAPEPTTRVEAEPEAPEAPEDPDAPLPAVPDSDSLVRELVRALSRHGEWLSWLASEELVLNFVRVVGAVAYDEPPQAALESLEPDEGFSVVRRGQSFFPAQTSYRRYDLAVEVFDSIDVDGAASVYRQLLPLFEAAHDELGYRYEFGDTLELAITKLLATPMLDEPPELRLRVISFEYVDAQLEALSPAQKLLLRLGPDNSDRVRAKLRELYGALD